MLRITIDGRPLDLEGIKFTLQLNSPFPFDPAEDTIEGSFAFGARFPASSRNKEIFDFPHRLERYPSASADFDGILFFSGRKLFDVIISLSEVTDLYFNANIKVGVGYYANLISDKTLRDLTLGGTISLGSTTQDVLDHAQAKVQLAYPETSHTFPPIYNPEFYGKDSEMNPEFLLLMNYYLHGSGFPANFYDEAGVKNYYNLVPCFFLMFVLDKCFTEFGYVPSGDFWLDQELQQLILFNNRSLDLIEERYKAMAELTADHLVNDSEIILFDQVNSNIDDCYDPVTGKYLVQSDGSHRVTCSLTLSHNGTHPGYPGPWSADVYLDDVMIQGTNGAADDASPFTVSINFDYYLHEASVGKYIYLLVTFQDGFDLSPATGWIYEGATMLVQNMSESQLNRYQTSITPADHMPDIKISELLIRLQKLFGIVYAFDHDRKQVRLLFIKDILNTFAAAGYDVTVTKSSKVAGFNETRSYKLNFGWPSSDGYTKDNFVGYDSAKLIGSYPCLEDLPVTATPGSYALVLNLNAIFTFQDDAWAWYTDNFQPLLIGAGKTEITPDVAPLLMWGDNPHEGVYPVYPKILQKGSSPDLGDNEFGFHLLFYRGMLADNQGETYPFASCTMYGPSGEVVGDYELRWDGDNGLYAKFLQEYYDFCINKSRPVEYDRHFTPAEISSIDFVSKARIFGHNFLIKQVSIPITESSLGVAAMKLIKS